MHVRQAGRPTSPTARRENVWFFSWQGYIRIEDNEIQLI
jgi:hypothetical protein